MADLKDFGTVRSWYDAYKRVLGEAEDKKKEDEKKKSPVEILPKENGEKEEEKQPEGESVEKLKAEIEKLKGELQKKDLEVKKKDAETTVEPNADTGEIPLRVGIAQSILDKKKKKEVKEETLDEKIDPKLKLRYMKTIVDMLANDFAQVISQSDYNKLMSLTKKMNKFENPRGASSTEKKEYETLVKKYANKLGSKKNEYLGYLKDIMKESLDEKLKVSDGLGAWIDDFMKSDAPQFKGKSDKEKKNMAIAAFTDAGGKLEQKEEVDINEKIEYVEYKCRNKRDAEQAKRMIDGINTMDLDVNDDAIGIGELTVDAGKKDFTRYHNMIMSKYRPKIMAKESLDESPVVDYARKLSSYAVKKGGMDRKDFMKIADRISKAKNDLDMKKIGKLVDDMDTEPRDLVKGSIALQMGPKTYKTMFGDRLTAKDMNQYKQMTPRDMREESLVELREPFVVVDTAQGNKVVGMASDEKEAQSIISSAERPPMRIKNKKTLKVVKVRKKQMIGRPLQENLDEVNVDAKGTVPSKQIASLKRAYDSLPDRLDPEKAMALSKMLDRFGEGELRQLTHADIKFISTLAVNKLIMKHKYKAKDIHDIRKNKPKTVFEDTNNLDEGYIDRLKTLMKKHNITHDGIDTAGKLRVKKDQVKKAQDIIKNTRELIQKPEVISRGY